MQTEYILYRHPLNEGKIYYTLLRAEDFKEKDYVYFRTLEKYPHVEEWVYKDDVEIWKHLNSIKNATNT